MNLSLVYLFSDLCQVCRSRDLNNQPSVSAATGSPSHALLPLSATSINLKAEVSLFTVSINALLHLKLNEYLRSHDAGKVYPGEDYITQTTNILITNT